MDHLNLKGLAWELFLNLTKMVFWFIRLYDLLGMHLVSLQSDYGIHPRKYLRQAQRIFGKIEIN